MLADFIEILALSHHIVLDLAYGLVAALLGGDEISCRINCNFIELVNECTCDGIYYRYLIHFVTEELDSYSVLAVSDADVDSIAPHSEGTPLELHFRS